ncbi:coiled-coil domain-containing protein 160 homolog [Dendronephthya gigantea]|uniref:coiled-coil domain-containing protein 160 homolog n=1 Tax=Dendronephthya gigantea TaxID=151771 RepID=UPI00106D9D47|nr:coiled-coil domain-containing protein 160 homolog [Dendronephthya gigantea]XP_028413984.1 coiled-coil domain-containing protein 160 homolog [Dendronephthya gigantea]
MAAWIEELFPPKFKVNDFFRDDGTRPTRARLNESFQEVYEKVFEEILSTSKEKDKSEHRHDSQEDASGGQEGNFTEANRDHNEEENGSEDIQDKCIWNADELKILRKFLKRSKLHNIRLSVLAQALQKDCERLRKTCEEQASEIMKLNRKYSDVRKQNKAMKIACKAFKEDAKSSQENFEICQDRMEKAIEDRKSAELELARIKHELEKVGKQNKVLQLELEKQKALERRLLENQNVALRSLHEKEITDLLERLETSEACLEKERNEHAITKKALVHLRLHFAAEET